MQAAMTASSFRAGMMAVTQFAFDARMVVSFGDELGMSLGTVHWMVMLRKAAAWGVVGFAALVVVFFARPMYRQGEPTVAGRTAQDFPTEIGGKSGHLRDLRGKVVVLNFWATYCAPCVEEMPSLNRLQKYIQSRNAVVLGASVDE